MWPCDHFVFAIGVHSTLTFCKMNKLAIFLLLSTCLNAVPVLHVYFFTPQPANPKEDDQIAILSVDDSLGLEASSGRNAGNVSDLVSVLKERNLVWYSRAELVEGEVVKSGIGGRLSSSQGEEILLRSNLEVIWLGGENAFYGLDLKCSFYPEINWTVGVNGQIHPESKAVGSSGRVSIAADGFLWFSDDILLHLEE